MKGVIKTARLNLTVISLFAITLLNLIAATTLAQESEDLSQSEKREVKQLAKRFRKRLRETQDLGPLIKEFFVADFSDYLAHSLPHDKEHDFTGDREIRWSPVLFHVKFIAEADRKELQNYYIQIINFYYLFWTYLSDRVSSFDDSTTVWKMLPKDVAGLFEGNEILKPYFIREEDPGSVVISDRAQLLSVTSTLEMAVALMRKKPISPLQPVKENLIGLIGKIDSPGWAHEPRAYLCDNRYGHLPKEMRLVEFYVPVFLYLHFIKVDEQFKILYVDMPPVG